MTKLTDAQMEKGRRRFLAGNADARRRVDALTQAHADAMYTTLEGLRAAETMKALAEEAYAKGLDSQELFLSCIADTAEEFEQMNNARLQAIQRTTES